MRPEFGVPPAAAPRGDEGGVPPGRYKFDPEGLALGEGGTPEPDIEDRKKAPAFVFLMTLLALRKK